MEITLNDGNSVYLDDFKFYTTYGGLIVGHPNQRINEAIIQDCRDTLFKQMHAEPYLIAPVKKLEEIIEYFDKNNPTKEIIEIMPKYIFSVRLISTQKWLQLPVIWLDDINLQMSLTQIIERSGIKKIDFLGSAEEYEL